MYRLCSMRPNDAVQVIQVQVIGSQVIGSGLY